MTIGELRNLAEREALAPRLTKQPMCKSLEQHSGHVRSPEKRINLHGDKALSDKAFKSVFLQLTARTVGAKNQPPRANTDVVNTWPFLELAA